MSATAFVTTVAGSATAFLPLTTPGPSVGSACAAAVYKQENDGSFLGWDPWWVTEVDSSHTTCWPSQAQLWWNQDTAADTTTILGTSFVCPSSYTEVLTSSIDAHTTQTFCCPTDYALFNVEFDRPSFPSQCISTLTNGQTLDYRTVLADGVPTTSTIIDGDAITIYGIPVNGLNIVSSTSSSTSDSSTPTAAGDRVTITASPTTASPTTASSIASSTASTSSPRSGQTSTVALAVGASVGAVAVILLVAGGTFLLWRRKRRAPSYVHSAHELGASSPSGPKGGFISSTHTTKPEMPPRYGHEPYNGGHHELDSNRYYELHELPVNPRGG